MGWWHWGTPLPCAPSLAERRSVVEWLLRCAAATMHLDRVAGQPGAVLRGGKCAKERWDMLEKVPTTCPLNEDDLLSDLTGAPAAAQLYWAGSRFVRAGDPESALSCFTEAMRRGEPDAAILLRSGWVRRTKGDPAGLDDYLEAVRQQPCWACARRHLADALAEEGLSHEADHERKAGRLVSDRQRLRHLLFSMRTARSSMDKMFVLGSAARVAARVIPGYVKLCNNRGTPPLPSCQLPGQEAGRSGSPHDRDPPCAEPSARRISDR